MKIVHKLILGFLTIVAVIGAIGYFSVTASQKTLQKLVAEHTGYLAAEILDQIDASIYARIEAFREYCHHVVLREAILQSNHEFEKLDNIRAHIDRKDKEWTSLPKGAISPFMHELINNKLSADLRERTEYYKGR